MPVEVGMVNEMSKSVQENDTAAASGGASLPPVLSTPRMIGWMEATAHQAIVQFLSSDQSSVGTVVNIRHLAATPVGAQVRLRAEILEVEGRRIRFKVEAWDQYEKIGEGEHERYIIDCDRFTARLDKKRNEVVD